MNYGYEGTELGELIQNYKTSNDKIIITFLDGTNYEIPLTEENEIELLNQMFEQAEERRKKSSIDDLKQKRKKALMWAMIQAGVTVLNMVDAFTTDSKGMRVFASFLGGITAAAVVVNGLDYQFSNDEIKELEKYDIYLQIRARLENINDPNLFNGVERREASLNINTLDSYSLSDIKKIRNNLNRSEKYSSYLDKDGSNPTLIKKVK